MATPFESVLAQYEKNKQSASGNRVSQEDRLKKYFTTILPKNSKGEERRIRILPTADGSSPFIEVKFHEIQVDGQWVKLYDPAQEGKRSPLNEVCELLMATGIEADKELARTYRSRKFYIVKVIDRDHEQDGVKFWRFKHNVKGEGILDKIFPIYRNKGDISDILVGRDLILSLSLAKAGNGKEYTTINSIMYEDPSPLSTDKATELEWTSDPLTWNDVYSKKPVEYLEMVAKGETPKWDSGLNKFISTSQTEETITMGKPVVADPQAEEDASSDLPF